MLSSTSSSKPLALGLALAILAASESVVWKSRSVASLLLRHQPRAANGDSIGVSARIRLWGTEAPLVLLGSSQVREGLECEVLAALHSPATCVNLGIGGGSPLDLLHIARRLPSARTVVIGIFPGIMHKAPKSGFIDSSTLLAMVHAGFPKALTRDDFRLVGLGLLQSLSGTLRHREGLREALLEIARGWPHTLAEDRSADVRRKTDQDRQHPRYFANRMHRVDADMVMTRFTGVQEQALEMLIARERAQGHRVVIADLPTRPGFETTLSQEVRSHYNELMKRLKQRTDIVLVEAAELGPLAEENFLDFTHVDSRGRQLMSERLGRLLADSRNPGGVHSE